MNDNSGILTKDESLEKEAPLLHSIARENPFKVPEGYFDSLPAIIMEKCREQVVSSQWSVISSWWSNISKNLISYILYLTTATASLAVICFLVFRSNNKSPSYSYQAMLQNIPDSLIVSHLENNINTINESTLEDYLAMDNETSVKKVPEPAGDDQDMVTYLLDNNVSLSDIENEP